MYLATTSHTTTTTTTTTTNYEQPLNYILYGQKLLELTKNILDNQVSGPSLR
jgi:hypothetical protein